MFIICTIVHIALSFILIYFYLCSWKCSSTCLQPTWSQHRWSNCHSLIGSQQIHWKSQWQQPMSFKLPWYVMVIYIRNEITFSYELLCLLSDSLKHTIFKAKNHHYWKPSFLLFSKLEEKKIIERTPIDQMYISYNWCQIFPNIWSNLDLSLSTKECYGLFCESEKIYTFPNKLSLSQLCNSNKVSIRVVVLLNITIRYKDSLNWFLSSFPINLIPWSRC